MRGTELEGMVAQLLAEEKFLDAVEMLEENGVRLAVAGEEFHFIAPEGTMSPQMIQLLRAHNRQIIVVLRLAALAVNAIGSTRLHGAVSARDHAEVERLLNNGARPNHANLYGQTPFSIAVAAGDEKLVEMLALGGGNPNVADLDGKTPLHHAVSAKNLRLASFLLVNGADPNWGDFFGQTPLCIAIADNNVEMAELLDTFNAKITDELRLGPKERDFLQLVLRILDGFSPELKAHSLRVADIARWLGVVMGLGPDDLRTIRLGGLLHDVGKVSLPADIFDQADEEVTQEDAELLGSHPEDGYNALSADQFQVRWNYRPIILHHHELWDGSGYPQGLAGEDIPLAAQLVGVADFYDHLVTHRQHDPAVPVEEAIEIIQEMAGTHFDPDIVEMLPYVADQIAVYSPGV